MLFLVPHRINCQLLGLPATVEPINRPAGIKPTCHGHLRTQHKKPMPNTSIKAPNKNRTRVPGVKGAMVMLKIITIAVIGSTDVTDSYIFGVKSLLCRMNLLPAFNLCIFILL